MNKNLSMMIKTEIYCND